MWKDKLHVIHFSYTNSLIQLINVCNCIHFVVVICILTMLRKRKGVIVNEKLDLYDTSLDECR